MEIDWLSSDSHVLLNPRMPSHERLTLEALPDSSLTAHLWLATSGTTGALKLTALSKEAMLISAAAVNRRLEAGADDVWACVLPGWHVGGLGIFARAFLSGARVVTDSWDAEAFAAANEITLASLVPAQVTDLIRKELGPPRRLRAIVVGGGAVAPDLYAAARERGWPVLPSYGMTECCSQVATARIDSPELELLDHVEARVEADGRLAIRSTSLLSGYATPDGFVDPRVDGWFVTEDFGAVAGRIVRVEGRRSDFVKIGGEAVDLSRLDRILAGLGADAAVVAIPDERLGSVIGLAVASGDAAAVASAFNERVFPYERARQVRKVAEIPRTSLGKLIRSRLVAAFSALE